MVVTNLLEDQASYVIEPRSHLHCHELVSSLLKMRLDPSELEERVWMFEDSYFNNNSIMTFVAEMSMKINSTTWSLNCWRA